MSVNSLFSRSLTVLRSFVVLVALTTSAHASDEVQETLLNSDQFGTLHLIQPKADTADGQATQVAIVLSDADGWTNAAEFLARSGVFVIGIDTKQFLQNLSQRGDDCLYIAGDLERLSQSTQKAAGLKSYLPPVLVGLGQGTALAFVAQKQYSPVFAGAVLASYTDELPLTKNFCPGKELHSHLQANRQPPVVVLDPTPSDFDPQKVRGIQPSDEDLIFEAQQRSASTTSENKHLVTTLSERNRQPWLASDGQQSILAAVRALAPHLDEPTPSLEEDSSHTSHLPLVILKPEKQTAKFMVVFLSGDGGWATIDKEVGEYLRSKGIPVVGFNCLKYFWKHRSPHASARALARIIRVYQKEFGVDRVILAGFSFGAEVIPFLYNLLPTPLQTSISHLVMIAPESTADFEVHIGAWLGLEDKESRKPILPELKRVGDIPTICIYGEDEDDSGCPGFPPDIATGLKLPGGHHFNGDYPRVGNEVLKFVGK